MAIRKATLLRGLGLVAVAAAASASLVGCSIGGGGASGEVIKIGYVTPQTGALAAFGEADTYVLDAMTTYFKDKYSGLDSKVPAARTLRPLNLTRTTN